MTIYKKYFQTSGSEECEGRLDSFFNTLELLMNEYGVIALDVFVNGCNKNTCCGSCKKKEPIDKKSPEDVYEELDDDDPRLRNESFSILESAFNKNEEFENNSTTKCLLKND